MRWRIRVSKIALNYKTNFGDWTLGVGGNFTYNKNKILNLGANEYMDNGAIRNAVGHSYDTYYIYRLMGSSSRKEESRCLRS